MAKSKANKGISRIDSGSTHGWFVRGYRNGKTYSKLFSDRKCGGKGKAQKLAKAYRDELYEELEAIPKRPRQRRIVVSDSRNTTGELGVSRTTKVGPNGTQHECYSVSWRPEPGVQKCTSFSIKKYGEKKAFKLAVDHRRKMMREVHGKNFYRQLSQRARKKAEA
ncbi:MAG: AP2 domain-containing protein [Opitutales bacterium]